MDIDHAADGDLWGLSAEEAWEAIEDCAILAEKMDNPIDVFSDDLIARLREQAYSLFGDKMIKASDIGLLSTPLILPSFETHTPQVSFSEEELEIMAGLGCQLRESLVANPPEKVVTQKDTGVLNTSCNKTMVTTQGEGNDMRKESMFVEVNNIELIPLNNENTCACNPDLDEREARQVIEPPIPLKVGYYLKHKINKETIDDWVENYRHVHLPNRAPKVTTPDVKSDTLPEGQLYKSLKKQKVVAKQDFYGVFEIPCVIGGTNIWMQWLIKVPM